MINLIRKIGKNRFAFTAFLLALITLGYYFLLRGNGISSHAAFSDAFHSYFWLAFFTFILQRIHAFYHSRSAINIVHISTIAMFSLIIALLTNWYGQWVAGADVQYLELLPKIFFLRWFVLLILMLSIVQQLWIDKHLQDQNQAFNRLLEKERQLTKAEMNNLQQQFQPHFLFNSLNSINALVKSQPEKAREMLINLSDFLRKTIQKGKEDYNNLDDEIAYLELYMSIEKVRFGERLQVSIDVTDDCKTAILPSLILQPLVENAIKFGVNGTIGAIQIDIQITYQNNLLFVSISNPFDSESMAKNGGTGYGLKSVERKLGLIYRRTDLLSIKKEENTFTVQLKIPQDEKNHSN